MEYTAEYDFAFRIIRVTCTQTLSLQLLRKVATSVAALSREHSCRKVLNDLRCSSLPDSVADIYNMPSAALDSGVMSDVLRALLVHEGDNSFDFLETVFVNRGNRVKVFTSEDSALMWLCNSKIRV